MRFGRTLVSCIGLTVIAVKCGGVVYRRTRRTEVTYCFFKPGI